MTTSRLLRHLRILQAMKPGYPISTSHEVPGLVANEQSSILSLSLIVGLLKCGTTFLSSDPRLLQSLGEGEDQKDIAHNLSVCTTPHQATSIWRTPNLKTSSSKCPSPLLAVEPLPPNREEFQYQSTKSLYQSCKSPITPKSQSLHIVWLQLA
jgi:hypothetical protein